MAHLAHWEWYSLRLAMLSLEDSATDWDTLSMLKMQGYLHRFNMLPFFVSVFAKAIIDHGQK